MKYKILRNDGDYDFINDLTINELPKGGILLTEEEWNNRFSMSFETKLVYAKQNKIVQLNYNRNALCLIPIEYNGNTFASTLEAKNVLCYKIISLLNADDTAAYYTYPEEKKIYLSKTDFKAIAYLIEEREIASRDKRYDLLNQINNANSFEELKIININF